MALSAMERKAKLRHGAQRRIAKKAGVAESYVSMVVNETLPQPRTDRGARTVRRVRVLVAREIGLRVSEVFPDDADEPTPAAATAA